MRRPHMHGKSAAESVMSADLSGPHTEAVVTKFNYMMVAVLSPGPNTMNLPVVRGLTSKSSKEVVGALNSVLGELNSLLGEQAVVRFHTHAGKEFVNKAMVDMLKDLEILPTATGGYDPQASGRADRFVGLINQRATTYLIHAKLPLQVWYLAVTPADYIYRLDALGMQLPEDEPTFGNRILTRAAKAEDTSLVKRTKAGIFLCWGSAAIQGAYVMTTNVCGKSVMSADSAPTHWPTVEPRDTWHLEDEPGGGNQIWISNTGRHAWTVPEPEDMATFEERTYPDVVLGIEERIRAFDTSEDRQWRRCHHHFG